jgi:hypothetical protein
LNGTARPGREQGQHEGRGGGGDARQHVDVA